MIVCVNVKGGSPVCLTFLLLGRIKSLEYHYQWLRKTTKNGINWEITSPSSFFPSYESYFLWFQCVCVFILKIISFVFHVMDDYSDYKIPPTLITYVTWVTKGNCMFLEPKNTIIFKIVILYSQMAAYYLSKIAKKKNILKKFRYAGHIQTSDLSNS